MDILEATGNAHAINAMQASITRDERQRSSIYTTAETILEAYADPRVLERARTAEIDPSAFLDGGRRSLTLVATTDGELRRLSLDSFEALAGRHPELARAMLFDLGKIVSLRLRFLTELIEDGVS